MPERRSSPPKAARPGISQIAVALLLPLLLYAPTSRFDFVRADDLDLIAGNQTFLRELTNVPRAFRRSYFDTEAVVTDIKTYYRPVAIVSFMLDAQRAGAEPGAYHVTNTLLHAAACGLLMLLAVAWGASSHAALAAALVFAVHPVNTQAVAWVAGRNDLLLAVFGLLSLIAWSRAHLAKRLYAGWIAVHVCAFALALFSKETGIFFPVLAVIHQRFAGRSPLSRAQQVGLGMDGVLVLAWAWLRAEALAGSPAVSAAEMMRVTAMNAPQLLLQAGKLLLPIRLNVSPSVDAPGLALGVGAVVALGWIAIRHLPRGMAIVLGCWTLAFIVPTLTVPGLPAYEHRAYLPMIGVLLSLSVLRLEPDATMARSRRASRRQEPKPRIPARITWTRREVIVALTCVVLVIFAIHARRRQPIFQDAIAYWTDAARDTQFAPVAHVNLGQLYEEAGRLDLAAQEYRRALALDPDTPKAHNNLGVVLMKQNQPELALPQFDAEVQRHPSNAEAWFNLGLAAEQRGDAIAARRHFEQAISANKYFIPAYIKLGVQVPGR